MERSFLTGYRCRLAAIVAGLCMPAMLVASSVTYTYTGQPFTTVTGNVQSGDFLSISLTLAAPLSANQTDEVVVPLAWSISDGVAADTLTNATSGLIFQGFEFATDGSAHIAKWAVGANAGNLSAFSWIANNWLVFGGITTLDEVYEGIDVSLNQGSPGVWTSTSTSTPEPSTAFLLISGACLLAAMRPAAVAQVKSRAFGGAPSCGE